MLTTFKTLTAILLSQWITSLCLATDVILVGDLCEINVGSDLSLEQLHPRTGNGLSELMIPRLFTDDEIKTLKRQLQGQTLSPRPFFNLERDIDKIRAVFGEDVADRLTSFSALLLTLINRSMAKYGEHYERRAASIRIASQNSTYKLDSHQDHSGLTVLQYLSGPMAIFEHGISPQHHSFVFNGTLRRDMLLKAQIDKQHHEGDELSLPGAHALFHESPEEENFFLQWVFTLTKVTLSP